MNDVMIICIVFSAGQNVTGGVGPVLSTPNSGVHWNVEEPPPTVIVWRL